MNFLDWLRRLRLRGSAQAQVSPIVPVSSPAVRTPDEMSGAEYLDRYLLKIRLTTDARALTVALRDYCGYVRQAAIERCIEIGSRENLAGIAERLNDWVPEVRTVARSALLSLVEPDTVPRLLTILPAVQGLSRKSRTDHSDWIGVFGAALMKADSGAVMSGVAHADAHVRRACFELLIQQPDFDTAALIRGILQGRTDNVLAGRAMELCATLPSGPRQELHALALRSAYPLVRAEALRVALAGGRDVAKDQLALGALLDPKMQPHAVAGAYLAPQGFDRCQFYRTLLAEGQPDVSQQRIAIVALAALSGQEDATLFRQSAMSPHATVRGAALSALLRAAPEDKDAIALAALGDSDATVRRIAFAAVTRHGAFVPFDTVARLLERARDPRLLLSFVRLHWPVMAALRAAAQQAPESVLVCGLVQWMAGQEPEKRVVASGFAHPLPDGADEVIRGLIAAGAGS